MKTKVVLLTIVSLFVVGALSVSAEKTAEEKKYDQIFLPDSLLTDEQIDLKYKIGELMINKVKVKKGVLVAKVSEKEFVENDIPLYYYNMLLRNIAEANQMIKREKLSQEQVEKSLADGKKDFLKNLEERQEKKGQ